MQHKQSTAMKYFLLCAFVADEVGKLVESIHKSSLYISKFKCVELLPCRILTFIHVK